MRQPQDITIHDQTLADIIADHGKWLRGEKDGRRANLADASLTGANLADAYLAGANLTRASLTRASLAGASLTGAYLADASGNMREVKSAQFDRWAIAWTTAPGGIVTLQIGCQRHALDLWRKSDPRWIAAMDLAATEWWSRYRDVVLALVDASPAAPHGASKMAEGA